MALRVRKNGQIVCAALFTECEGDTYINDDLHYQMSVVHKVIVTEINKDHLLNGKWWWRNDVPEGITIDEFYLEV